MVFLLSVLTLDNSLSTAAISLFIVSISVTSGILVFPNLSETFCLFLISDTSFFLALIWSDNASISFVNSATLAFERGVSTFK